MAAVIELKPAGSDKTMNTAQKLYLSGDYAQAGAIAEMRLRENPDDAQALAIVSAVYKQADRIALAYLAGRRATEIRPDRPETWACHGFAAQAMWRMDEALSCYKKALQRALTPHQKALYNNNIASAYLDLGKFSEAEKYVDESLKYDPKEKNTRHNKGLCLLAAKRWDDAWNWYSASIGSNQRTEFRYMKGSPEGPEPCWDGKPFAGILAIYGEQGLGDEICAASAIPDIIAAQKSAGGRVIIDCDRRLQALYRRSFPEATVHGTRWEKSLDWPEDDRKIGASIACFEVLKHFRTKVEDFPATPYLKACPERVKQWNATFDNGKPTIGIAWTGGTWKNAGSFRKLPIQELQPLFEAVDANWVSLQYKDATSDIEGTSVKQYSWATLSRDYDDTAALVASCDLVIGVPTSVIHLAGALGVPTICMKAATPCWKFAGDSLAFTPDVKLIENDGSWASSVAKAAKIIPEMLHGCA